MSTGLLTVAGFGAVVAGIVAWRVVAGAYSPVQEHRQVLAFRALGVVGGLIAAAFVISPFDFGLDRGFLSERIGGLGAGLMLAPAAFGLVVVVFVALAETLVRSRRSSEVTRTASLAPRRVAAYLPRRSTRAVAITLGLLLACLGWAAATAAPDAYGEMRALKCGADGRSVSPYPGGFYGVPLLVLVAAVLVSASLAAWVIVHRPRGSATVGDDDRLRRRSLAVVVAGTGMAFATSYAGVAWYAGLALAELRDCNTATWNLPLGVLLLATAGAAALIGGWCLIRMFRTDELEESWS